MRASRLIKAQLAMAGLNQEELAERLSQSGRSVSAQSVRSKISRGTFSAGFLLEVMAALNCKRIDISDQAG